MHNRLLRDITLLVLFLISLFLTLSYLYSKQVQNEITQAIISSAKEMLIEENHQIFDPITKNLTLSRKWAELEQLTTKKHNIFNKRFIPILETLPQISSVILASSDGSEYFFTRQDENWLSSLEFSNFINLIINQIEGKTILVVECERADRPTFLHNKSTEDFYIRSGPASVKLSVSKVLKYVRNRY